MNDKLTKNKLDKMSFEDTITNLETLVREIETGQCSLEQSLAKYETGMQMISHCREILNKCEEKLEVLSK